MDTLKKVQHFIHSNRLFQSKDSILVGLSGGADSVVLLHILLKLGYKCVAAHCNFHLRGEESDRDETFVANLVQTYGVLYKKVDFDTVGFAKTNKISIEMAARKLRYDWFDCVARETDCQVIAVAHHKDDSIETMLLNLIRGTGLRGLTGIEPKRDNITRPLLCCTRKEIEHYASENKLEYVTDSTNLSSDYSRNKIRNQLLPLMEDINPSVRQTLFENTERFKGIENVYLQKIEDIKNEITFIENKQFYIHIGKLKQQANPFTALFELLQPYHFNADVIENIIRNLDKSSGNYFFSDTHRLLKDRAYLIVDGIELDNALIYSIAENAELIHFPIEIRLRKLDKTIGFVPSKKANTVHIDADKVEFPLTLRKWQEGDSFCPFGMSNKKKVSDFFINEKLNRNQKEDIWLLLSGNEIVWIVGMRLDNRFRITENTIRILELNVN